MMDEDEKGRRVPVSVSAMLDSRVERSGSDQEEEKGGEARTAAPGGRRGVANRSNELRKRWAGIDGGQHRVASH